MANDDIDVSGYRPYIGNDPEPPRAGVQTAPGDVDVSGYRPYNPNTAATTPDPAAAHQDQTDWANTGWGTVGKEALYNLPSSAWNMATALPQAAWNYDKTWQGMKAVGRGAANYAGLYDEDAAQAEQDRAAARTAAAPYIAGYHAITSGDTADLKRQIATDPVGTAAAYVPVYPGSTIGKVAGAATKFVTGAQDLGAVGRAASAVNRGVGAVYNAPINPIGAAVDLSKNILSPIAREGVAAATGVPGEAFTRSFQAGKIGGPEGDVFNKFASGTGTAEELSEASRKAVSAVKQDAINDWKQSKQGLATTALGDVPLTNTNAALSNAWTALGPESLALDGGAAHGVLRDVWSRIYDRQSLPFGDPARSLEGVDQLKQALYDTAQANQSNPSLRNALLGVHNGVGQDLRAHAPGYADLMDQYQSLSDNLQNISKSLGTGDRVAASTELKKLVSAQKTPQGRQLIDQLAAQDSRVPYMIAGASLNPNFAVGGAGRFEGFSIPTELGAGVTHALMTGNYHGLLGAAALGLGQSALQSPHIMGGAAYYAGKAAGAAPDWAGKIPGAYGVGNYIAEPLKRAADEKNQPRELTVHPRASGGAAGQPQSDSDWRWNGAGWDHPGDENSPHACVRGGRMSDESMARALSLADAAAGFRGNYRGARASGGDVSSQAWEQEQAQAQQAFLQARAQQLQQRPGGAPPKTVRLEQTSLPDYLPPTGSPLIGFPTRTAENSYRRGGRVRGHQHLVDRLFRHIERAKRAEGHRTSVLLNQPDEAIAKALSVAQAAI